MIPSTETLKVGDKVYYQPEHYSPDEYENGIVKEIRPEVTNAVWVVYNCDQNWKAYRDYTSAKTRLEDLFFGWR